MRYKFTAAWVLLNLCILFPVHGAPANSQDLLAPKSSFPIDSPQPIPPKPLSARTEKRLAKAMVWLATPAMTTAERQDLEATLRGHLQTLEDMPATDFFLTGFFRKDIIRYPEDLDVSRKYSLAGYALRRAIEIHSQLQDPEMLRGLHASGMTVIDAWDQLFFKTLLEPANGMKFPKDLLGRTLFVYEKLHGDTSDWMDKMTMATRHKDIQHALKKLSRGDRAIGGAIAKGMDETINREDATTAQRAIMRVASIGRLYSMNAPWPIIKNGLDFSEIFISRIPRRPFLDYFGPYLTSAVNAEFSALLGQEIPYREWFADIILHGNVVFWMAVNFRGPTVADYFAQFNTFSDEQKVLHLAPYSSSAWREKVAARLASLPNSPVQTIVPYLGDMPAQYLPDMINRLIDDEKMDHLFLKFEKLTDVERRRIVAEAFMARVNAGSFDEKSEGKIWEAYPHFLSWLPRRVGVLTNIEATSRLYDRGVERFMELAAQIGSADFAAGKDFWLGLAEGGADEDSDDNEMGIDDNVLMQVQDLMIERDAIFDFFIHNPSKELLKHATDYWHRGKLLSDRERNAANWIANNIPKGSLTRDSRRRLHRYIVTLVEARMRSEADNPGSALLGQLLANMNTVEQDREKRIMTTGSFLELAMQFMNLAPRIRQKSVLELSRHIAQVSIPLRGPRDKRARLVLEADGYSKLLDIQANILLKEMIDEAVMLDPSDIGEIEYSIANHRSAWMNDGLLISLLQYHGFQDETGKASVELYLLQLATSEVEQGHFKNIPRYEWGDEEDEEGKEGKTRDWFGDSLQKKLQKGFSATFSVSGGKEGLAERYRDIWADILVHLHLQETTPEERMEVVHKRFSDKGRAQHFDAFWGVFSAIESAVQQGREISAPEINQWRKTLQEIVFERVFPFGQEVFVNFNQLLIVQRYREDTARDATFVITEAPVDFIRSAEKPYYTCQRITEPTGENKEGRPINRASQGQFILAKAFFEESDPEIRSILEVAMASATGKKGQKVLLVERLYSTGAIPSRDFQNQIIQWAAETGEFDYVAISGSRFPENISTQIEIELMPSIRPIYRDTDWPRTMMALDIVKYKARRENGLKAVREAITIRSSSSYRLNTPPRPVHSSL